MLAKMESALAAALLCVSLAAPAWADSYAYTTDQHGNFGVVDLTTGGYTACGNDGHVKLAGLAQDSRGHIYGASFPSGTFYSVNPANGALTYIRQPRNGVSELGSTTSHMYVLDFVGHLYKISSIGNVHPIGLTGVLLGKHYGMSTGSSTLYLENDGSLYALNTTTGKGQLIGSGSNEIYGMVTVNNVLYGSGLATYPTIWSIDPSTGAQTQVSTLQSSALTSVYGVLGMVPASNATCAGGS